LRVLVTRSSADAARTAEALARAGFEPLAAPLFEVRPTAEEPPVGPYDAVVITSAKAAAALASKMTPLPLFAVGPRSAAAAQAVGWPEVHEAEGDAASLARLIAESLPAGARLLHVAGRDRKDEPARGLGEAGFQVDVWRAYDAVAVEWLPGAAAAALREGHLAAVLHYSRRAAETFVRLVMDADLLRQAAALRHCAISDDAAAPLRNAGFPVVVAAPEPNEIALFGVLQPRETGQGGTPPHSGR
jgi:uroporphyrinogen-III synthase